jgi:hypothetical protein
VLKQIKNYYILASIILAIVVISLVVSTPTAYPTLSSDTTKKQQQPLLSIISTRDTPIFTPAHITKLVRDTITQFIFMVLTKAKMMLERNLIEYKPH